MSENIKSGWLKDSSGRKFAPSTIINNLYGTNGDNYDTIIKNYIATELLKITLSTLGVTYSTTDLTAGSSALKTGSIYLVYE